MIHTYHDLTLAITYHMLRHRKYVLSLHVLAKTEILSEPPSPNLINDDESWLGLGAPPLQTWAPVPSRGEVHGAEAIRALGTVRHPLLTTPTLDRI